MMKLKTKAGLSQSMRLALWLRQSVKLLSLSQQELKTAIDEELLSNPLLENTTENSSLSDFSISLPPLKQYKPRLSKQRKNGDSDKEFSAGFLPSRDIFSAGGRQEAIRQSHRRQPAENPVIENLFAEKESLTDHLKWQAKVSGFPEEDKYFLFLLISHLDERGFLNLPLNDLAEREQIPLTRLEIALKRLKTFDPEGCGSDGVKEFLLMQARQHNTHAKYLSLIIQNHLESLQKKRYRVIARSLKITLSKTKNLLQILMSFSPEPAVRFTAGSADYITPDIYIRKTPVGYEVEVSPESFPELKLTFDYKKALEKNRRNGRKKDAELSEYLKDRTLNGKRLVQSLQQRKVIILKITTSLIRFQKDFFDKGPAHLKHIVLRDIASDIGIHPSTVSRAVANKFIQTSYGVFPLKRFFAGKKGVFQGQTPVSPDSVKAKIKEWLVQEDKNRPVKDIEIVERLQKMFQVKMSRRTVSKYRQSLGFASSRDRKVAGAVTSYTHRV